MFWPFALKQLNSLTSIDAFSCLDGQEVTLKTGMWEVLGSIPGPGKDFYVCFFVLLLLLCFFVQKTLFTKQIAMPFAMLIHLVYT